MGYVEPSFCFVLIYQTDVYKNLNPWMSLMCWCFLCFLFLDNYARVLYNSMMFAFFAFLNMATRGQHFLLLSCKLMRRMSQIWPTVRDLFRAKHISANFYLPICFRMSPRSSFFNSLGPISEPNQNLKWNTEMLAQACSFPNSLSLQTYFFIPH